MNCNAKWILVLIIVVASGCSIRGDFAEADLSQVEGDNHQQAWGTWLEISKDGALRMTITAWYLERVEEADSIVTSLMANPDDGQDRVTVVFFDSTGSQSGTLTAESIRFNETDEIMSASGSAILSTTSGRSLQSERINWDQNNRTVAAPGFVNLATDDEEISGFDLQAKEDLSSYSISRITGTVVIRESSE